MRKNIVVKINGRQLEIKNLEVVKGLGMAKGLMFTSKERRPLLFEMDQQSKMAIHSLFVFHPFLAVWMNNNYEVTEWRYIKPFNLHVKPKLDYSYLLEVPLNKSNVGVIDFIDGGERFKN